MYTVNVFCIFCVCGFASVANWVIEGEYYWRPWTSGSPPSDAIFGRDYRGVSYITQAYASNFGEFVGQAFANQHEVNVSALHVNASLVVQTSHSLKVLCTQNRNQLVWYPTNSKTLQNELLTGTITPVLGGENPEGTLYIGRYVDTSLRSIFFGSVCNEFNVHYHNAGKSYLQSNYEILVVNEKCTKS